jgi:glyoxylate utilization-related uncharacterized protein
MATTSARRRAGVADSTHSHNSTPAVAGAHGRARQLENQERVLYVLEGAVEGQADQRAFEARAGSLVFVPEGAV